MPKIWISEAHFCHFWIVWQELKIQWVGRFAVYDRTFHPQLSGSHQNTILFEPRHFVHFSYYCPMESTKMHKTVMRWYVKKSNHIFSINWFQLTGIILLLLGICSSTLKFWSDSFTFWVYCGREYYRMTWRLY